LVVSEKLQLFCCAVLFIRTLWYEYKMPRLVAVVRWSPEANGTMMNGVGTTVFNFVMVSMVFRAAADSIPSVIRCCAVVPS